MTTTQHPLHLEPHPPEFTTSEGLRRLLLRLHEAGPHAWQQDREAAALLEYVIEKYGRLARKWHRDPADAGYAAFVAMRSRGVTTATDPWGVITRAVQRSIVSETMGDRLLISAARARKGGTFVDAPTRAGDRDWLYDRTPILDEEDLEKSCDEEVLRLREVIADIVDLLIGLGWPGEATDIAVDYILSRTGDAGSLKNAREILRKETDMPARFGLPATCWPGLLRVLLGGKTQPGRPTRKGVLIRLLNYDTIDTLLEDDDLIVEIALAAPGAEGRDG
ncbi:hypothetical protein [Gulosibacter chungangensis]|uniref:Uncharacterized protein n=1 Tax=Gulosibacter chungangensis TaxID=979746 RepID=A0A7J5B863_9MICO|nr:hypothetical protein [Gulosibacter chungangensis]KAB1641397.1 hypothetical protein F8O05_12465 [Gulosibacter chungangensis]